MIERTNEERLELFADLIEPVSKILADKDVTDALQSGKNAAAISIAIKRHKKEIIEVLARIDDVPVDEYKVNILALPVKIVRFMNQPEVKDLFTPQSQEDGGSSGSATGITEDGVQ